MFGKASIDSMKRFHAVLHDMEGGQAFHLKSVVSLRSATFFSSFFRLNR
jgi:hypothetical protein